MHGLRQRGGRIVLAQALVEQKAEEAPQRRRAPGHRRGCKVAPLGTELRKGIAAGVPQPPAEGLGGALKVRAIGDQSVAGSPGLGRHHVEETIDEDFVLEGHVRASASAAIIRAV